MKALILYMTVVFVGARGPVHAPHMRPMPEARAAEFSAALDQSAAFTGLPRYLLFAVAWSETALDGSRVGKVGERGVMQNHPRSRAGRAYARVCKGVQSAACDRLSIRLGAEALAEAFRACGTYGMAIGRYKSGKCIEGPAARRVLSVWAWAEAFEAWSEPEANMSLLAWGPL